MENNTKKMIEENIPSEMLLYDDSFVFGWLEMRAENVT